MHSFPLPSCPAKQSNLHPELHEPSLPVYLIGPYGQLAFDVICGLLRQEVQYFLPWTGGSAARSSLPAEAETTLCLYLTDDYPSLPEEFPMSQREAYFVSARRSQQALKIDIVGGTETALRYGLIAWVTSFISREGMRLGWQTGWPDFEVRGIVEGFYGPPWSHTDRLSMLSFLDRYRFNTYLYAPKDDIYHRQRWRDVYPRRERQKLQELADDAARRGIHWIYGIAPGLTIEYSSQQDVDALMAKVDSVIDLGIQEVALLLDDIPETMLYESDRRRFASVAASHAYLAGQLWDFLQTRIDRPRLLLCPTEYCGAMMGSVGRDYLSELGRHLPETVEILWTGPDICSQTIPVDDAEAVAEKLPQPLVYWDNYPVNDCAMYKQLHIGPFQGRDPGLKDHSLGFLANPMWLPEASKLPLATLARFCWDAFSYQPARAFEEAMQQAVASPASLHLQRLAETCRQSPLDPSPASPLADTPHAELGDYGRSLKESAQFLAQFSPNQRFIEDVRPWLQDLYVWGDILVLWTEGRGQEAAALMSRTNADVQTIGPYVEERLNAGGDSQ